MCKPKCPVKIGDFGKMGGLGKLVKLGGLGGLGGLGKMGKMGGLGGLGDQDSRPHEKSLISRGSRPKIFSGTLFVWTLRQPSGQPAVSLAVAGSTEGYNVRLV
jgi:hypothetical protein